VARTTGKAQGRSRAVEEEGREGVTLYDGEAVDISRPDSTLTDLLIDEVLMDRMVRAVERVSDRLHRATGALESARIPYVVADDQAVRAWIARVNASAVRNTPDVDILLRRSDLDAADVVLSAAGFMSRVTDGTQMFLMGHLIGQSQSVIPSRASLSRPRRFTSSASNGIPASPRSILSSPG
jgi:hypothetical protein